MTDPDHPPRHSEPRRATPIPGPGHRRLPTSLLARLAEVPTPAAALALVTPDRTYSGVIGTADLRTGEPAGPDHWWDLASLTKTLATLPAIADLVTTGRLGLDEPLDRQWPRVTSTDIGRATLRQVLAYDAGMPATKPFYLDPTPTRTALVDRILRTPAERPAGRGPVYSDLSFIAAGELAADLTGQSLDELTLSRAWVRYQPTPGPHVAYEDCQWRQRTVKGEVHDENAFALGGIAGHAGAFATLAMAAEAAHDLLVGTALPADFPATVEQSRTADGSESYGLGFYLPPTRRAGGLHPGPASYGATGYVGNRLWVEPQRGYAVVILTNRVHPHRGDRQPFSTWCETVLAAIPDMR